MVFMGAPFFAMKLFENITTAVAIVVALIVTVGFGVVPGELDSITRDAIPQLVAVG